MAELLHLHVRYAEDTLETIDFLAREVRLEINPQAVTAQPLHAVMLFFRIFRCAHSLRHSNRKSFA